MQGPFGDRSAPSADPSHRERRSIYWLFVGGVLPTYLGRLRGLARTVPSCSAGGLNPSDPYDGSRRLRPSFASEVCDAEGRFDASCDLLAMSSPSLSSYAARKVFNASGRVDRKAYVVTTTNWQPPHTQSMAYS